MERVKKIKGIRLVCLTFVCVLLFLFCFCIFSGVISASAEFVGADEVNVVTSEDTGYNLKLSSKGLTCFIGKKNATIMDYFGGPYWDRSIIDVSVILRFNDVKIDGKSTLILGTFKVDRPSSWSINKEFIIQDDINIRISLGHYNLFNMQPQNLSSYNITFYASGHGFKMGTSSFGNVAVPDSKSNFNISTTVGTYELKPGEDDPNNPNFNPGGSGGVDNGNTAQNLWNKFVSWFLSIWGSTTPLNIFWQIAFVIVGVIIIAMIVKFFKWLAK